ncbi:MAG: CooT family nickel-binding protein [Nitrospiraceae bacterium]|nr:CooT family nickel-binding protein [Nitrospiraceae bacterium]
MCQSTVYLREGGEEREILRDAILVEPCPEGVRVQGFFDSPKVVPANIVSIDLLEHKIILRPKDGDGGRNSDD